MPRQPIPEVSDHDVERVARRDFRNDALNEVLVLLDQYGSEASARVRLAAMKLAAGSIETIRAMMHTACQDYRDILAGAEYPQAMKIPPPIGHLPADERQRIYDADWEQYQQWLHAEEAS